MMLELALIIIGLVLLWKGSDLTVDASKKLALKFGISHALIGLTLVSIGTSLPEISTNIYSGLRIRAGADVSGIAVGLILGSQISQITFILGSAALFGVMYRTRQTYRREAPMLFIAIFGLFLAGMDGYVSPLEALALMVIYFVYLFLLYKDYRTDSLNNKEKKKYSKISTRRQSLLAILGLAILIVGGKLVVDSAEVLAEDLRVSDTLVGILIVGPGAALPELSVAISGMRKKASGISLGALLGSNITDPLFSFSIGAIFAGYTFDTALLWFDIPYWTMATCVALGLMRKGKAIGQKKTSGLILISIFIIYVLLKLTLFQ